MTSVKYKIRGRCTCNRVNDGRADCWMIGPELDGRDNVELTASGEPELEDLASL